jgi:hypothetical protein
MKEIRLGTVAFDSDTSCDDPYIIGLFGAEGSGKTRFAMTGPDGIGFVVLEQKSYKTIASVASELGKTVFKPKDPSALIVNPRKVNALPDEIKQRQFFKDHIKKVTDVIYGMLDHPDVRILCIDKFTQLCTWIEFAINGMEGKTIKIKGNYYKDKRESDQEIIDLINSLSQAGKPVILTGSQKEIYENDKPSGRMQFYGFRFIGSHCNVVAELQNNPKWNPNSDDEKFSWHFQLCVRHCQANKVLEGPDGNPLLRDDMVTFPQLVMAIDPDVDMDGLV